MKKLYLLSIILLALSWCGQNQTTHTNNLNQDNKQAVNTVEKEQISMNTEKNNEKLNQNKRNTEQQISDNQEIDEKQKVKYSKEEKEQEIKIYKKEYTEKLNKLENMWPDEMSKLRVLAHANCAWVCNLDMKDTLTPTELKIAQECNKQCIEKQKQAKEKLEQIRKQLEKEKQAYPAKCFQNAEKRYEEQQKMFAQDKQKLPKDYKLPSKEEIVKSDANRCILIYGYTNYDCEKIKDYKEPYEKCKRLRQLQSDLQFIDEWKYKTFDDYLQNKNMY